MIAENKIQRIYVPLYLEKDKYIVEINFIFKTKETLLNNILKRRMKKMKFRISFPKKNKRTKNSMMGLTTTTHTGCRMILRSTTI